MIRAGVLDDEAKRCNIQLFNKYWGLDCQNEFAFEEAFMCSHDYAAFRNDY